MINKKTVYTIPLVLIVFVFSSIVWFCAIKAILTDGIYGTPDNDGVVLHAKQFVGEVYHDTNYWGTLIPNRERVCQIDAWLSFTVTKNVYSEQVLFGKNRWLFYQAEETFRDYEGKNFYSEKELKELLQSTQAFEKLLDDKSVEFALLVAPNKEHLYREMVPSIYQYSEISRTDLLIEYLTENKICAINVFDALESYKNRYPLYYRYDTHWNQLGAYVGVSEIMKRWDLELTPLEKRTISSEPNADGETDCRDDLAMMSGLQLTFQDEMYYTVDGTFQPDWKAFNANEDGLTHFTNPDAMYNDTVFLIGDSFRKAMIPVLREQFADVFVVHRSSFQTKYLNEVSPDYVIVEYVERYSGQSKELGTWANEMEGMN